MIKNRHNCVHYDCLIFSTLILLTSPNVAKHTYVRSPLEQYHKIGRKKKKNCSRCYDSVEVGFDFFRNKRWEPLSEVQI
jgi:hypothetical protein